MISLVEHIRSRLGAKFLAVSLAAMALSAAVLIGGAFYFVGSLTEQAASESSAALRAQGRASLERLTREQARRYNQLFREAGSRSGVLARRAGYRLTAEPERAPAFPLDLRWRADKAFYTNAPDAPISLLHWGQATVTATARQQMRVLTRLGTALNRARAEVQGATAAWITTEGRVVAYAPNLPLVESITRADKAALLDSRFYRIATPGNAAPDQTRWTEVYQDPAGQGLMVTAATPIYGPDNETFLGVAGIDLTIRSTVNRVLTQDPLGIDPPADANGPPAELSFLMDAHTRPVAVPADHRSLLGLPANPEPGPSETLRESPLTEAGPADLRRAARRAVENDHLLIDDLTLDGETYLAAFHTIPATDWVVANVVAEEALLSTVTSTREAIGQRVQWMTVILVGVGAGLMLLMAAGLILYFRRAVLRPLGRLAEATERMGSGQYRVEVPVRGEDELARVSQGFNDLSDRLADLLEGLEQRVRARTREAESARDHFRTILDSSPVGIAFLDQERHFQQINPAFEDLVGRSAEALRGQTPELIHCSSSEFDRVGREAYPQLQAGDVYHTVTTLQRPDGQTLTVSLRGQAVNSSDLKKGYIWVLQDITEQRARERTLEQFRAVFEGSRDAVMLMDEAGYTDCNPATLTLFRAPDRNTFLRYHPGDFSPEVQPDGRPSAEAAGERIRGAFEQGWNFFEWTHSTFDGEAFPTEVQLSRIDLDDGPVLEVMVRDISERKAAIEEIRQARDRAETYFELVRVMMLVLDTDGRVAAINQRGCEIVGLEREELMGADWFPRFVPDSDRAQVVQIFEDLRAEREGLPEYVENTILTATGDRRLVAFHNTVLRDGEGRVEGILASGEDITEQRQLKADLEHQANHDPLTGIHNRRKGAELLEAEIQRTRRYGTPFSVILFDIDYFKPVNDQFGHAVGDAVLQELTALAWQRLREVDSLARWGGEEFLVLLPETPREGAERVAEELRREVAASEFTGVGRVTISLGVAELAEEEGVDHLLQRVDDALYAAKAGGRNRVA